MEKRVRITRPTGRKPMRIGALLLKEVSYQNEWRIQATWRDPDRKKKWFNNWRFAEEFAAKENKRLDELKEKGAGRYTFNDAADSYVKKYEDRSQAKDNSGCTLDSFATMQAVVDKHLRPRFGHMRLAELSSQRIEDWIAEQGKIAKPRTVRNRMGELNRVLNHAVKRKGPKGEAMLLVNPLQVEKVDIPGKILKRAKIPDRSDLEVLRKYLTDPRPVKHSRFAWSCKRMIVLLSVSCGMRAGECSALEWDDIDPETGEIDINKARADRQGLKGPKSEAGYRKVPTTPAARAIIDEHAQVYKEIFGKCVGPVLRSTSRKTDHVTPEEISRRFKVIMRACGLVDPDTNESKFTHHAGRHWCASHWMKSTADVHQVAKWLGHKNVSMTLDIYGHCLDDPEAREKFQRIPDWLSPVVQIDAPSSRPIEMTESPIDVTTESPLALPTPEDSFELGPAVEVQVEPDCPIHVPDIAEPFVKPLIRLLHRLMPVVEAYYEIMPLMQKERKDPTSLTVQTMRARVTEEFRRLKLPLPKVLLARFRDEKILALHAKGYQSSDIARMVGCHYTQVDRVRRDRHKGNANNPLNRKLKPNFPKRVPTQPQHKIQLKLL